MATWENRTVGVYDKDALKGYLSVSKDYSTVCEIYLNEPVCIKEVLGVYLGQYKRDNVKIEVYPLDTAVIKQLSALAESVTVVQDINFNVIDYPAVLNAFLRLKNETTPLPDGELTVCIHGVGNITITVAGNRPAVAVTDKKPDAVCTHTEAMNLFFSPVSAYSIGPLDKNNFARSLFPLPLFIRSNDRS
jgi:hypothetical protein